MRNQLLFHRYNLRLKSFLKDIIGRNSVEIAFNATSIRIISILARSLIRKNARDNVLLLFDHPRRADRPYLIPTWIAKLTVSIRCYRVTALQGIRYRIGYRKSSTQFNQDSNYGKVCQSCNFVIESSLLVSEYHLTRIETNLPIGRN